MPLAQFPTQHQDREGGAIGPGEGRAAARDLIADDGPTGFRHVVETPHRQRFDSGAFAGARERKGVVEGKSVSERVALGGRRTSKKKKDDKTTELVKQKKKQVYESVLRVTKKQV